jgi:hypothetical protein
MLTNNTENTPLHDDLDKTASGNSGKAKKKPIANNNNNGNNNNRKATNKKKKH